MASSEKHRRRAALAVVAPFVVLGASVACNAVLGLEPLDAYEGESSPDTGSPPSEAGDAIVSEDAEPIDSGTPQCPTVREIVSSTEADSLLSPSVPDQNYGGSGLCNTNSGRCVLRFAPSVAVMTAFKSGRVTAVSLRLRRADAHDECTPDCTTPTFRQPGTLFVHALATDWVETEVNWQRRRVGNSWAEGGASAVGVDIGPLAGQADAAADTLSPEISLAPSAFLPVLVAGDKIALRVEFLSGTARRPFVVVTHDNTGSIVPFEPPKLSVTYCVP